MKSLTAAGYFQDDAPKGSKYLQGAYIGRQARSYDPLNLRPRHKSYSYLDPGKWRPPQLGVLANTTQTQAPVLDVGRKIYTTHFEVCQGFV